MYQPWDSSRTSSWWIIIICPLCFAIGCVPCLCAPVIRGSGTKSGLDEADWDYRILGNEAVSQATMARRVSVQQNVRGIGCFFLVASSNRAALVAPPVRSMTGIVLVILVGFLIGFSAQHLPDDIAAARGGPDCGGIYPGVLECVPCAGGGVFFAACIPRSYRGFWDIRAADHRRLRAPICLHYPRRGRGLLPGNQGYERAAHGLSCGMPDAGGDVCHHGGDYGGDLCGNSSDGV